MSKGRISETTYRILRRLYRRYYLGATSRELASFEQLSSGKLRDCLHRLKTYGWVLSVKRGEYRLSVKGLERLHQAREEGVRR